MSSSFFLCIVALAPLSQYPNNDCLRSLRHPPAPSPRRQKAVASGSLPRQATQVLFRPQMSRGQEIRRFESSENLPLASKQTLGKKPWMAWCVWQGADKPCPGIVNLNSLGSLRTGSEAPTNVQSCSTTPPLSLIIRLHPVPAPWCGTTPVAKTTQWRCAQIRNWKGPQILWNPNPFLLLHVGKLRPGEGEHLASWHSDS